MKILELEEGIVGSIKGYFRDRKDFPDFRDIERTKLLARMKAGVPAPHNHSEIRRGIQRRADLDAAATYRITSMQGTTDHDKADAKKMVAWLRKNGIEYEVAKIIPKSVDEDLGPEQKKVGQLGPTEKVGANGAVGKLVGANESFDFAKSSANSYYAVKSDDGVTHHDTREEAMQLRDYLRKQGKKAHAVHHFYPTRPKPTDISK